MGCRRLRRELRKLCPLPVCRTHRCDSDAQTSPCEGGCQPLSMVYVYAHIYIYIAVCVRASVCVCPCACATKWVVLMQFLLFLAQVMLTLFTYIPEPTFVNQFLNDVCCCILALWAMTYVMRALGTKNWAWGTPTAAACRSVPLGSSNATAASQAAPLL